MKLSLTFTGVTSILATLSTISHAHTIFQQVSVNGAAKGNLVGMRAPDSDYPVQDVTSSAMTCNTGITHTSTTVIDVPAGAKVGTWWGHVIGGAQSSNDPDNPIAASHKGPIQVYLASVPSASTATASSSLKWFKVGSETLNTSTGLWAVDTMIANQGWWYFTLPTCIPAGNYLMRVELLALHSAYSSGGAQFYMECAQINVVNSAAAGKAVGADKLVSFPGAYQASDPSILINIYGNTGKPDNGGKAYTAPGPALVTC